MKIRNEGKRRVPPDIRSGSGNRSFLIAGAGLAAAAAALQAAARLVPGFADWYAHGIYAGLAGVFGRLFGLAPFSVVELLLYLLLMSAAGYLFCQIRHPLRILSRAVFLAGLLLFLYMAGCGVNYQAAAFSRYVGIETGTYTVEELKALCAYLTGQVNAWAPRGDETAESSGGSGTENSADGAEDSANGAEDSADGTEDSADGAEDSADVAEDSADGAARSLSAYRYQDNRARWRAESVAAMQKAGEQFPVLAGFYPEPKEVTVSWILSVQQLCGIYSPFTIEANYNGDMPDYNVPHTMCHELSHLKGFMREDEANFIGYLACTLSDDPAFCYSGYLTGWVYAGNALASVDRAAYLELYGQLCAAARRDLQENNAFWDRYEGKVAEAANQWNDVYLKMNDQPEGVRSYGRMVDLMLAYRRIGR